MNSTPGTTQLRAGDRVLVGRTLVEVDDGFAGSLLPGDTVLGVASSGVLRRLPRAVVELVEESVASAREAFAALAHVPDESIDAFFDTAAMLLADDAVFAHVREANDADVSRAMSKGRSTTRLVLADRMRTDMVEAFSMWKGLPFVGDRKDAEVAHPGWMVEERRAPLGVIGFVFEGRPNVFADATGVLKGRNTVVFRIGSDALGTAEALMDRVVGPALRTAGLPESSVVLLRSAEHAAGWALFSDPRVSLAVARGSGAAVAELGSIARQSGLAVSLHGTGGAWLLVGEEFDDERLSAVVKNSLDRKVCNTMNVVCVARASASRACEIVWHAAHDAAATRGTVPRIHAVNGAEAHLPAPAPVTVVRAGGRTEEPQVTVGRKEDLGHEFEWEETPEFHLVVVDDLDEAIGLFNTHSPRFIASVVSSRGGDLERAWQMLDAPFFGDGFTRWVDGQFALRRPELGLSNWEGGRLFARGGILSGDSAYTVRLRMRQSDPFVSR